MLDGLTGAPAVAVPLWLPFLAVGGLVATDLQLPTVATGMLMGAVGFLLGYPNGLAMAESGQRLRGVIGSTAAIFVLVTLIAALAAGEAGSRPAVCFYGDGRCIEAGEARKARPDDFSRRLEVD